MPHLKFIAFAALVTGCTDEPAPSGPFVSSQVATIDLPGQPPPRVDVLVVIDDTTAMVPHQARVAELPALLETTLRASYGGMGDLRIAIATNDGSLRRSAGVPDGYVVDTGHFDGTRTTNYAGSMAAALATIVNIGAASTAASRPLAAMQSALDEPFVRDGAYLAVVTIGAADDASPGEPSEYVTMLKARQADPANVIVSGIYAAGATRLDAFHQAFPNRNAFTPVDATDWTQAFDLLAQLNRRNLGAPCFPEPLDLDPETPGGQYDCSFVWDDRGVEHALPFCGTVEPCIELAPYPPFCMGDHPNLIRIQGWVAGQPHVRGQCVVK